MWKCLNNIICAEGADNKAKKFILELGEIQFTDIDQIYV